MSTKIKLRERLVAKKVTPRIQKIGTTRRLQQRDNWQLFSLTIPGLILMILFNYLPMSGLVLAFKNFRGADGIWGSAWNGFDNFEFFFKSGVIGRLLKNTLGMNFLFLIVNTVVTVVLALLLFELRNRKLIRVYQTVVFLPFVISWVAAAYAVYANFSDGFGIVNSILESLGLESISWYKESKYWPTILLGCYLWKQMGYGMIIYYGNLMAVDSSYYEAATLDGANRLQMAWYISWPVIRPTVIMFFILTLGRLFSADFGLFYYVTKNSTALYETVDVIDTYVFRALKQSGNIGMSAAIGLMQSVIGLIVLLVANKLASKVDEGGAVF